MKSSKSEVRASFHKIPRLRFQPGQKLTSYSGLVIFQALFAKLALKDKLRRCVSSGRKHLIYGPVSSLMLVVLLLLLGFRRLRDLDDCREDPMLARILGLKRLPHVSTVSRHLARLEPHELSELREHCIRGPVLDRLQAEGFARVTLDFDGLVQTTSGHAEGTAVGFNRKCKGARSYYPQFCTVAQTDQFFDMNHRPGNVHDSNGADEFMGTCFWQVEQRLPGVQLESRFDSAMFNETVFLTMVEHDVEFSCSVPFERFPALKRMIEACEQWRTIDSTWSYFETSWKPKSWDDSFRLILVRKRRPVRRRGPLQLDFFVPLDHEYEYTAVATNKTTTARNVVEFHHGRGSQEKLFGEANQNAALNVVAGKKLTTNRAFTIMSMLAHNLSRELQMTTQRPLRSTLPSRTAHWRFFSLRTLRQRLLHRAGKLACPQGELTLTMNANPSVEAQLQHYLDTLTCAL